MDAVAVMKLLTELTTLLAALATDAMLLADALDDSDLTALWSFETDWVIALVSAGRSFLARLTNALALVWIFMSCVSSPLTPPLALRWVRPLTAF